MVRYASSNQSLFLRCHCPAAIFLASMSAPDLNPDPPVDFTASLRAAALLSLKNKRRKISSPEPVSHSPGNSPPHQGIDLAPMQGMKDSSEREEGEISDDEQDQQPSTAPASPIILNKSDKFPVPPASPVKDSISNAFQDTRPQPANRPTLAYPPSPILATVATNSPTEPTAPTAPPTAPRPLSTAAARAMLNSEEQVPLSRLQTFLTIPSLSVT